MIQNFKKLKIWVEPLRKEILHKRFLIRASLFNEEYDKAINFHKEKIQIYKQIQKLITDFKSRLKGNYLEQKLFASEVEALQKEIHVPDLLFEIIYCAKSLFIRLKNMRVYKRKCEKFLPSKVPELMVRENQLMEQIVRLLNIPYTANIFKESFSNKEVLAIYNRMIAYLIEIYEQQKSDYAKQLTFITYLLHLRKALEIRKTIKETHHKIELLKLL